MLRTLFLSLALMCLTLLGRAQGNAAPYIKEADRHFQKMAYARAIQDYTTATEMGAVSEHVTKRLAECYMRLGQPDQAERWYSIVVKFLNREPVDMYNYAEALKGNGKYVEAEEWMDRYLAAIAVEGASRRSNISGFARNFLSTPDRFIVRQVSVNTPYSDFGTAWLGADHVMFSSSRNETTTIERRAAWNDQPFLDLFSAHVTPNGDLVDALPVEGAVNTRLHEGPATANAAGDVLWFTRNGLHNGRVQRSNAGVNRLAIYKAYRQGGAWGQVEQFLYNNSETSVCHPALSPDGKRLYFVSDMPGGHGGTDIYACTEQAGQWSEPVNLGSMINTPRNEAFPFIGSDGTLYFSSNGHPGLGGMDIMAAKYLGLDEFAPPMNVGAPVNGTRDDFAFIIDKAGRRGFFSSNRPGGKGDDDIYAFEMLAPLEQRYLVSGLVIDDDGGSPVVDVRVDLLDKAGAIIASTNTDARGEYTFSVERDKEYQVRAEMKGRYPGIQHLSTDHIERRQILTRDIHLVPSAGIRLRGTVRRKDGPGFEENVIVTVVNLSSFFAETVTTGESGDFGMPLQSNEDFEVLLEKPGFYSVSIPVSTIGMKEGIIDLNEVRDLSFEPVVVGAPVLFRYIRWAKDGTKLDPVARTELDAFADRLNVNPGLKVEIAVHSDSREPADAAKIDQRRAEAIVDHLVGKGIKRDRLVARGYGSSRLVNHCAPGVRCTEAEHSQNRRVAFTVLEVAAP